MHGGCCSGGAGSGCCSLSDLNLCNFALHCFIHSYKHLFLEALRSHKDHISISMWCHDPSGGILKALCGIPFSVYKVREEEYLTFISFFCCLEIWSHTLKIAERGVNLPNP